MTRQLENEHSDVIRFGRGNVEISLVKGGKRSYLWIGEKHDNEAGWKNIITFTGATSLRKLAKAILKEIPESEVTR